jgi:hypothetical protein
MHIGAFLKSLVSFVVTEQNRGEYIKSASGYTIKSDKLHTLS